MARVQEVNHPADTWKRVTGPGVSVVALPSYPGLHGILRSALGIVFKLNRVIKRDCAVILRIPSVLALPISWILTIRRHPYGVEVVGDVAAGFSKGAVNHPLRPLLKMIGTQNVRQLCWNACAAAYVTEHTLQQRYPPSPRTFVTHYSSVELPDEIIRSEAKNSSNSPFTIVSVGSMARTYKRFDVLIKAVEQCRAQGLDVKLVLIGDGEARPIFEEIAHPLGEQVHFTGELPGSEYVREELMRADLFVLASAHEGLPRAMIEAMAAGLPCIGTTVGGTPELLPQEDMVSPGDVPALAKKLMEVLSDPTRMRQMSERNLATARRYSNSVLREMRHHFYEYIYTDLARRRS